jgi:LysM repeat protein
MVPGAAFAGLVAGCAGGGTSDAPAPVFLKGAEAGFPGQPGFGSRAAVPRRSDERRIVVQHGQSLREVAQSYQVSEQSIIAANHLRPPYRVVAGQTLLIPGRIEPSAQPAVAAAPLAAPITRGSAAGRSPPDIIPLDGPAPARAAPPQNSAGLSPPPPPAQRPVGDASAADEARAESSGPAEVPKHGGRFAWPVRGRVLAGYGVAAGGSHNDGINIAAVFDNDPDKVGRTIGSNSITDSRQLVDAVREKNIIVGVVAVPAENAQQVAQELIDSGVRIIFNYSEALLDVPHDVTVHTSNPAVDLLHALYFHLT